VPGVLIRTLPSGYWVAPGVGAGVGVGVGVGVGLRVGTGVTWLGVADAVGEPAGGCDPRPAAGLHATTMTSRNAMTA
jgi:hypothetical protein